jgi:hypothetical protein
MISHFSEKVSQFFTTYFKVRLGSNGLRQGCSVFFTTSFLMQCLGLGRANLELQP